MRVQRRETLDFATDGLAVKVRRALARLTVADDHLRRAITEVNALIEASAEPGPAVLSQALRTLARAAEEVRRAGDVQPVPHWDHNSRVLSLGSSLVKRYRMRADNQVTVLAAFEEEGWPRRIDDPLRPRGDLDPKYRLHFTIECLNQGQQPHVIRFSGDGTGEGVCWELREAVSRAPAAAELLKRRRAA
jgi:hypothetical protein